MKPLLACSLVVLLLSATQTFAGIDSGGGKLSKDDHNPWFLENTASVSYCIDASEDFGVPAVRLQTLVQESLGAWKAAFASNVDDYYAAGQLQPSGQVRIGTQTFEADCSGPDLRFQFGKVTPEQRAFFDSIQEYVGAAVRTQYDRERLRAKGFVYIAPLIGELKPNTQQLDPEAWMVASNVLLRLVLLHELGHVFGVRHQDQQSGYDTEFSLMSERLPEFAISTHSVETARRIGPKILEDRSPMDILQPRTRDFLSGCDDHSPVWLLDYYKDLFGLDRTTRCVRIELETFGEVKIYESASPGEDWLLAGTLSPRTSGVSDQDLLIKVYVTASQEVFATLPDQVALYGAPLFAEVRTRGEFWEGQYAPSRGQQRVPMRILIENGNRISSTVVTPASEFVSPISGGN